MRLFDKYMINTFIAFTLVCISTTTLVIEQHHINYYIAINNPRKLLKNILELELHIIRMTHYKLTFEIYLMYICLAYLSV